MLWSAMILAAPAAGVDIPKTPLEAVAMADARPGRGTKGVFRMTVAATGRLGKTVFLNSLSDYHAPDDLTFELTGSAAKALTKRLSARPETALLGRSVTARGSVEAIPIVLMHDGRTYFSRYQHRVLIRKADQLSVD